MKRERPRAARSPEEARFLESYRPGDFPRPSVTVDLVVFTVLDKLLHALLVRRNEHPFKGSWALPGGFVRVSADRHDQGANLSFADGHVERWRWRTPKVYIGAGSLAPADAPDYQRVQSAMKMWAPGDLSL